MNAKAKLKNYSIDIIILNLEENGREMMNKGESGMYNEGGERGIMGRKGEE